MFYANSMLKFDVSQLGGQDNRLWGSVKSIFATSDTGSALMDALSRDDWIDEVNLATYFSPEVAEIFRQTLLGNPNQVNEVDIFAPAGKGAELPSLDAFLATFLSNQKVKKILLNAGFSPDKLFLKSKGYGAKIDNLINSTDSLFNHSAVVAIELKSDFIGINHILLALKRHSQKFVNSMAQNNVDDKAFSVALLWHSADQEVGVELSANKEIDWLQGFSGTAKEFLIDVSQFAKDSSLHSQIVGKRAEITATISQLLADKNNNVLLVGKEGSGKKTIVNGLALEILSGSVPEGLKSKHVVELNLRRLFASESFSAQKETLFKVLNEVARRGNMILFIDNLPQFLNQNFDTGGMLVSALSSDKLQVVASATPEEFNDVILPKLSIVQKLERLDIEDVSGEPALVALGSVAQFLERQHSIILSVPATQKALFWAQKYLTQMSPLEGAIRILETASTSASYQKDALNRYVSPADIEQAVASIANVSLVEINRIQKDKFANLSELLQEKIVGQDEAVAVIDGALQKVMRGLSFQAKPMISLLFTGVSGVGKTHTAQSLADIYFESLGSVITVDLRQKPSKDFWENLGAQVTQNPNSVILLENADNLDPVTQNDLADILSGGSLKLNAGKEVSLSGTVLILTAQKNNFESDFLENFDGIAHFKNLEFESFMRIIDLQITELNKKLKNSWISVGLTPTAKEEIAKTNFDPERGAHHLQFAIKNRVEALTDKQFLEGKIKAGDRVILDAGDLA